MVGQSELATKLLRAKRQLEAAEALEREGLLEQAAAMHWAALRTSLFASLEGRGIEYASTRDALVIATADPRMRSLSPELIFAHLVGTIAEWDECFAITIEQLNTFKGGCAAVRCRLGP